MRVTQEPVRALAFCQQHILPDGTPAPDGGTTGVLCEGYAQVEVDAILEHCEWLYGDSGGDSPVDLMMAPMTERSTDRLLWPEGSADMACPYCGFSPRALSLQIRPNYPRASRIPPDAILQIQRDSGQAVKQTATAVESIAQTLSDTTALRAELAAVRAELAEVKGGNGAKRTARPKEEA